MFSRFPQGLSFAVPQLSKAGAKIRTFSKLPNLFFTFFRRRAKCRLCVSSLCYGIFFAFLRTGSIFGDKNDGSRGRFSKNWGCLRQVFSGHSRNELILRKLDNFNFARLFARCNVLRCQPACCAHDWGGTERILGASSAFSQKGTVCARGEKGGREGFLAGLSHIIAHYRIKSHV